MLFAAHIHSCVATAACSKHFSGDQEHDSPVTSTSCVSDTQVHRMVTLNSRGRSGTCLRKALNISTPENRIKLSSYAVQQQFLLAAGSMHSQKLSLSFSRRLA